MKEFKMTGIVAPQSLHNKSLPGGDASPGPQSFNKKKAGSAPSSDLRPAGYRPTDKWNKVS